MNELYVRRVKFKFLAQLPVGTHVHPVVFSVILSVLICCIRLLCEWSFRFYHHINYICYYVASHLIRRSYKSKTRCKMLTESVLKHFSKEASTTNAGSHKTEMKNNCNLWRLRTRWPLILKKVVPCSYIYIYIYSQTKTDCFVLSELFSVAINVGHLKPVSKPV